MITFILSICLLVGGYFVYGRFLARYFGLDPKRPTPAISKPDGVDFIPMPTWKAFMIQFLNIAGLGPIFGAILGAAYGPAAYLWIVFGCIFMGAMHDFMSGMLSVRNGGANFPALVGKYLGHNIRKVMLVFSVCLLICVGVSFVMGPAELMNSIMGMGIPFWVVVIFIYYILATLLPIDKIIGNIYPIFAIAFTIMAVLVLGSLFYYGTNGTITLQELSLSNLYNMHAKPEINHLFPMLFVVISCGAISGFHCTQSPLMARTIKNEKYGYPVFYGAMICEGLVAMIWATAAINFYHGVDGLNAQLQGGVTPAIMVNTICTTWMGKVGAFFAIIGIVVCPITSGDTAFRSARLIIAEAFKVNQGPIMRRLYIAVPMFVLAIVMSQMKFTTIWNFVGISNQMLSMFMLWTIAVYLKNNGKVHWIASIPAAFMTCVCVTYFMIAPLKLGGLGLPNTLSYAIGGLAVVICGGIFLSKKPNTQNL